MTEAIKRKLTQPSDVVDETRAAREHGSTGRKEAGKVVVDVEETWPGYIAAKLKESDQMAGQTFNDPGRRDDEGGIRLDRQGKM